MFLGLQVKSVFVMQFTKVFCFKLICHLILVEGETVEGETTPPHGERRGHRPPPCSDRDLFFVFPKIFEVARLFFCAWPFGQAPFIMWEEPLHAPHMSWNVLDSMDVRGMEGLRL